METLEHQLAARFPRWFAGRRKYVVKPLLRGIAKWSRIDRITAFVGQNPSLQGFAFVEAALEFLGVHHHAHDSELRHIPAKGRVLIVSNHPLGALDALALLSQVSRIRKDVRIVANDLLTQLPNLQELFLPVRIIGGTPGRRSVSAVEAALKNEECVIVFPAGEVSRLGWNGVMDGPWRRGFVRFARSTNSPVIPVKILARNSVLFYGASTVHKSLGTSLLAREMFARSGQRLQLRIGAPLAIATEVESDEAVRFVRETMERLDQSVAPATMLTGERIIDPVPAEQLETEIGQMPVLGRTSDGHLIVSGQLNPQSRLLREIGRLREVTFREVGEGTGRALDVDVFDTWYEHIVLWDSARAKIAGAYRIARGARVLAERGIEGWYTASLFDYSESAIERVAKGMELGRSFVAPEYWGGRSIDYLWQGIGAYLRHHPSIRYLYGPVSISAALPMEAREQIVDYYATYYGDRDGLGQSKVPFACRQAPPRFATLDAATAFKVLRENLNALGATLPMLYKQYTELCEPDGVRFLAFGVDRDFQNAIDGLIEVDIDRMRPHKRARYLNQDRRVH